MTILSLLIVLSVRCLLVVLFLPFSALDKIVNFSGAVKQAGEIAPSAATARALICIGLVVEVVMSLGIITGIADRLAAFVLAGYCGTTALLWKQFWKPGDFFVRGASRARDQFWDFLKNFSLAGGFLLMTFGTGAEAVKAFLENPTRPRIPIASRRRGGNSRPPNRAPGGRCTAVRRSPKPRAVFGGSNGRRAFGGAARRTRTGKAARSVFYGAANAPPGPGPPRKATFAGLHEKRSRARHDLCRRQCGARTP